MENKTNIERGELIDIILTNDIHPTPLTSVTDQMYRVGNDEAFITIQCDINGKEISSFCIKRSKPYSKYIKFADPADAAFVSNACKKRLEAQIKEQEKANKLKNQRSR